MFLFFSTFEAQNENVLILFLTAIYLLWLKIDFKGLSVFMYAQLLVYEHVYIRYKGNLKKKL